MLSVVWLRTKYKDYYRINSKSDIKQEMLAVLSSNSYISEMIRWQQQAHNTVPFAPKLMHHLWIAVITNWWMFSERSGPDGPHNGVAGSSTQRWLHLCTLRSVILLSSCSPEPKPWIPHPLPVHYSCVCSHSSASCVCVCTCMHACSHVLVTGLLWAADCHPGAMPWFLQSTLQPSFILMNG